MDDSKGTGKKMNNRVERFGFLFLVGGLGLFAFSVVVQGVLPWFSLRDIPMEKIEEISQDPTEDFYKLASVDYPEEFARYFGEPSSEAFAETLLLGKAIYIAEGCWHCHSQFVRPVSNEDLRFGRVSTFQEHQNELQMPPLLGTRRVGPDLIRESGKHTNDWHIAHFYEPRNVVPTSVMPSYRWFFDEKDRPNKKGLAIVTYIQWLGSWEVKGE